MVIQDRRVQALMDELELPPDRANLFEIIDADGSGTLQLSELVPWIADPVGSRGFFGDGRWVEFYQTKTKLESMKVKRDLPKVKKKNIYIYIYG